MEYKRPDGGLKIYREALARFIEFSNLRQGVNASYAHENRNQSLSKRLKKFNTIYILFRSCYIRRRHNSKFQELLSNFHIANSADTNVHMSFIIQNCMKRQNISKYSWHDDEISRNTETNQINDNTCLF